jgi:hypothetical protein
MGGTGNQMFQYAFARNLSLKYNKTLKIDLSFLKNKNMGLDFVYRDYSLNIFNIYEDFNIDKNHFIKINEPCFEYEQSVLDMIHSNSDSNFLLNGYWQTSKYFKEFEKEIRKDFTFRDEIENSNSYVKEMLNDIKSKNSVLLNIRRTDYLSTNYHGVMGKEYIDKGVKLIESKIKNPRYFLFSDDLDWCRENIKLPNMTIVNHSYKGDRFSYYLQLMKNCKHFIIPNSSFAWWAAWLNQNENKIVIAPKQWFTDTNIKTTDLIPNDWIRI